MLDIGVWLRGVNQVETIPTETMTILRRREVAFGLSAISLWEVGKKVQIGKLKLPKDLAGWFADALAPDVSVLPLTPGIIADAVYLPEFPVRDPADELIVATARVHKLTLLTTDTKLKDYPHARVHYFTPVLGRSTRH